MLARMVSILFRAVLSFWPLFRSLILYLFSLFFFFNLFLNIMKSKCRKCHGSQFKVLYSLIIYVIWPLLAWQLMMSMSTHKAACLYNTYFYNIHLFGLFWSDWEIKGFTYLIQRFELWLRYEKLLKVTVKVSLQSHDHQWFKKIYILFFISFLGELELLCLIWLCWLGLVWRDIYWVVAV